MVVEGGVADYWGEVDRMSTVTDAVAVEWNGCFGPDTVTARSTYG